MCCSKRLHLEVLDNLYIEAVTRPLQRLLVIDYHAIYSKEYQLGGATPMPWREGKQILYTAPALLQLPNLPNIAVDLRILLTWLGTYIIQFSDLVQYTIATTNSYIMVKGKVQPRIPTSNRKTTTVENAATTPVPASNQGTSKASIGHV